MDDMNKKHLVQNQEIFRICLAIIEWISSSLTERAEKC